MIVCLATCQTIVPTDIMHSGFRSGTSGEGTSIVTIAM